MTSKTKPRPQRSSADSRGVAAGALALYRGAWSLASAVAPLDASRPRRSRQGGYGSHRRAPRPRIARATPGTLVWVHGASVGELIAALPLVSAILEKQDRHVLVTTGTVTSARLMGERLPPRAFHQYAPLDSAAAVRRFLDHWRPDLALFVEFGVLAQSSAGGARARRTDGADQRAHLGALVPRMETRERGRETPARVVRRMPGAGRCNGHAPQSAGRKIGDRVGKP